ncbi:aliphatic sulfonate ABC transporter substrate-binding protein [soil metagenome]
MTNDSHGLTRRHFLAALGAGAATLGLAGCGGGAGDAQDAAGDDGGAGVSGKLIRVAAFTNNHAAGPLYWPQFAPEGLEVEVTTLTSGTDMNRALEADDLDFAIFGIVNGFIESEQGLGSKIVAMGARQGAGLIVPRTSEIADVAGLAGRRIALKGPAFQLLVLYTLLDEAGLDPASDVEIVPVEYNDQPTALERGDVDAFMGSEPNASRSVASGKGRRLVNIYTTPVGELNSTIWASPRMVADEPDLVRAAVAMQRDAANHLTPSGSNDPEVWRDLVVDQFGLEEDVYRELITNCGAVWELSEFWVDQAKAAGAKMAELRLLQAEPDYDDLIRTEFMPA